MLLPRLRSRLIATLLLCACLPCPALASRDLDDADRLRAAASTERARPRAPRLERATFLTHAMLLGARLSPDGKQVAALVDDGRERSVWVADVAHPAGRRLLARTEAREMAFSRDGRWLFLAASDRIDALAMAGQAGSGAIARVGERNHHDFAGVDPWRPAAVLSIERPPSLSAKNKRWRLWRTEVGGATTLMHDGTLEIVDAAFAPDGQPSHLLLAVGEGHVLVHRDAGKGWRALARCRPTQRCAFLGTSSDGRELWLRTNLDGDLIGLSRLAADGTLERIHADPRGEADLDRVVLDPVDNTPLLANYHSTVTANHGLTAQARTALAAIAARFPRSLLRLEAGHGGDARWLVRERRGTLRGERLHLFDPRSGRSDEVLAQFAFQRDGKPAPRPPEAVMATQVPVAWRASDGLRLHGFVWLPPGIDAARAPLVVSVHGGPFNLVRPDFSVQAQFLANRGYIVFAPNFRSSTGLGRNYVLSGKGDFGGDGRVQRDIVEGTRWLLANGIGDPARVGIVGASFGGYSTLLGLSFQPELFKVGIASVPPSDFAWVLREYLGAGVELTPGVPMAVTLRHFGVDPEDRALMARLHAGSPTANAARMARPLLLLAGGEDERVPIRGVTDYATRLKALDKDVSLFVDDQAGHGIGDPRTREAYLYLEEVLLHRHLGGGEPQPADAALRAHLRRNLRLVGPSLVEAGIVGGRAAGVRGARSPAAH